MNINDAARLAIAEFNGSPSSAEYVSATYSGKNRDDLLEAMILRAFDLARNPYLLDMQLPCRASSEPTRPLRFADCHNNVHVRRGMVTLGNGETFAVMPGSYAVDIQYDGVTIGGHRKYSFDELGTTERHVRRWIDAHKED